MTTNSFTHLPVAVIGAGPVGLAAAAHLVERGLVPLVFEAGPAVADAVTAWGHVRVFSPWRYNVDAAARRLLEAAGWTMPPEDSVPTGAEIVQRYLAPLAALPDLAPHIKLDARVISVSRAGLDKMTSGGRDAAPFVLRWTDTDGAERQALARAVIDTSGTYGQPNPMGIDGLPVPGERQARDLITYGLPDVLVREREAFAGRHVLVVGSGHSAINVVLDLLRLRAADPATQVSWALRRDSIRRLRGGGLNDQLPARGALGLAADEAIAQGRLNLLVPFAADRIEPAGAGLLVVGRQGEDEVRLTVGRIVVATGSRPNLDLLRELRVELDPMVEAPPALAPLIDPNLHSCGTVPPHGAAELRQPEAGFYIAGAKSYGRAPTFLMATGYEQVRSIVAEVAGDAEAAREVHLVLPETGVCSAGPEVPETSCCPAPIAVPVAAPTALTPKKPCCGTAA